MTTVNNHVYLAIDIEKTGRRLTDPIVAIGVAIGDKKTRLVLEKRSFYLPVPKNEDIEKNCWDEFWSKPDNLKILEHIRANQQYDTEKAGIEAFDKYLDELTNLYPGRSIEIVSDNPAYDIGSLDYVLHEYCNRYPLRYTKDIVPIYRWIVDPSERLEQLGKYQFAKEVIEKTYNAIHDHEPSNDAHFILCQQFICDRIRENDSFQ